MRQYPQDTRARKENIEAVIDRYFDFESMARLAVGQQWDSLSREQQQKFTAEFKEVLLGKYLGDIEKYARPDMTYRTAPLAQGYVIVRTVLNYQGNPVSLEYFLHLRNGDWKVYDVSIEGMSLVINYRQQFGAILANGSFSDLSNMLRREIVRMCEINRNC
jgi:phospholipid transport system substrate-binding protein